MISAASVPSGPWCACWLYLAGLVATPAMGAPPTGCPAAPEARQAHAARVLADGVRPWSFSPLPAQPPAPLPLGLGGPQSDSRREWVRRLTFVLSGLPPREDDVAAFLADVSPRALDKVLDRLLAASTAPQRLTEVWLRAAGHADRWPQASGPASLQPLEAWKYRDWVVSTLRATPDVRRLALMTLAGDSQSAADPGVPNRAALSALSWHLTTTPVTTDFEETVIGWSIGQAERTARTFLGLDLSCARCHDHPALPLPSDEAAGLVAVFAHSHAFVRGKDGSPERLMISTASPAALRKQAQASEAMALEEAKLEALRREFALVAAAEFLPQTAEYVRAAWAWHHARAGTLAGFAATRGLLEEPLHRWVIALGLEGETPAASLSARWWLEWEEAREAGTAEAVAAAAQMIQASHQVDVHSPFFTTSRLMDAFFSRDQQSQLKKQASRVSEWRRKLPDSPSQIPSLAEGPPPGIPEPAMTPGLPSLLTGGPLPTPISPPGAGRRALATWLDSEGATFFSRLAAVRLAEGLGCPLLPAPSALHLWAGQRPPEAAAVDDVAACLVSGGWPAAAKRILQLQTNAELRPVLRLGGSEWRDAILFVAGTLDPKQGGPPDRSDDSSRRSLYREWAPLPATATEGFLNAQAAALASLARRKGGSDPTVRLHFLTRRIFQRPPNEAERTAHEVDPDDLEAFCARLLRSEEFLTLP